MVQVATPEVSVFAGQLDPFAEKVTGSPPIPLLRLSTKVAVNVTSFGGTGWKTYGWALAFLVMGVADWAFAAWEFQIIRSEETHV